MSDKTLKSFKIGDKHKPRVTQVAPKGEKPAEAAYTMGFARIETLLDSEQPGAVGETLARILDDLDAKAIAATTPRDKNNCKKARAAVERTIDLLDYLFRTKAALQANAVNADKK